jgi:2'-5' RNA ligase
VPGRIRWLHSADLHITLVFLGATSPEQVAALHPQVSAIADGLRRFAYTLDGPRLFPDARRPRVLALEPRQASAFVAWHEPLAAACRQLGFALDSRPYRPHLSLARVRGAAPAAAPASAPLDGVASSIVLFESRGGRYRPLFTVAVEQAG